jgi:hypothetical protein
MAVADLHSKEIEPLNVNISINGDGWLCATVETSPSALIFPIIRQNHWEGQKQVPYNTENMAILYTLAVLYLVGSLFGIVMIVAAAVKLPLQEAFFTAKAMVLFFTLSFMISTILNDHSLKLIS